MTISFFSIEWGDEGRRSLPVIMNRGGLFQDLVVKKQRDKFFDFPDHVVDGMFPKVA